MKIIFLETVQSYGGAQIATVAIAGRLRDAGHDVAIIDCYGSCTPFIEAVNSCKIPLTIIQKQSEPFVIHKYNSRIRNGLRMMRYIPHWIGLKKRLKVILSNLSPDFVICYNHKALSLLEKSDSYKIGYYAHGWYIPTQIPRTMRNLITTRVDRIIAISQATRMALYAGNIASLENIFVVHNAIDISLLSHDVASIPKSEGCFKVLISAGFLADKGIHIAIEIAKTLKERGFPIKLIITGIVYKGAESPAYYNSIMAMIDKHDLHAQIMLVRDKPNVMEYFRACDCLIHPSSTEGLPLVIMEAMAMRKPVIANAVGGVTDMVIDGYTGVIAPHNSVEFYADAIERIARNAEYRNFIVDNAYSMIERTFDTKTQISQFEQVLNSL